MDYDTGLHVSYGYLAGRLNQVNATLKGVTTRVFALSGYDGADVPLWMSYGNGLSRRATYDLDGRLTMLSTTRGTTTLQGLAYSWDSRDRITGITNSVYPAQTQSFGYDDLSRLTSVSSQAARTQGFAYDADGNRTSQTWASTEAVTMMGGSNQLLKRGDVSYGYDANGNRTSRTQGGAVTHYAYDPFNRLASATQNTAVTYCEAASNSCPGPVYPAGTTVYKVNALGQRTSKSGPKGSYTYAYMQDGRLATVTSPSGTTYYIYANGEPVALVRANALYYLHDDHLGRPELATNSAGSIVWRAENYAFSRKVVSSGLPDLDLGLPGQVYDSETGHWNNGFRDYDSQEGRICRVILLG
jgi:YD repeat-containing protein